MKLDFTDRKKLWLWLTMAFGYANPRMWELLEKYDSLETFCDDLANKRCGYVNQAEAERAAYCSFAQACAVDDHCRRKNIHILTYDNDLYPDRLRQINCPPAVLFVIGDVISLSADNTLSMIGTRTPSDYSSAIAREFSSYFTSEGFTIISGFAMGVDSISHHGALDAGGRTIAVLGSGIEYDYPRNTMDFKRQIAANGAVVSEFFPQAKPLPENFKVRNRIVAALSKAVLVVEAGIKSGTLNTVNHALEQGRDVFVIPPHDIFSDKYAGQCALLKDGAEAVYSPKDLLEMIK